MDKAQIKKIAQDTLKGAVAAAVVGVASQLTKDIRVGDRKIVLFTARR